MVIFLVIMIKGLIIVYSILHSKARAVLRGGEVLVEFSNRIDEKYDEFPGENEGAAIQKLQKNRS